MEAVCEVIHQGHEGALREKTTKRCLTSFADKITKTLRVIGMNSGEELIALNISRLPVPTADRSRSQSSQEKWASLGGPSCLASGPGGQVFVRRSDASQEAVASVNRGLILGQEPVILIGQHWMETSKSLDFGEDAPATRRVYGRTNGDFQTIR